jgi:hypothetical protein
MAGEVTAKWKGSGMKLSEPRFAVVTVRRRISTSRGGRTTNPQKRYCCVRHQRKAEKARYRARHTSQQPAMTAARPSSGPLLAGDWRGIAKARAACRKAPARRRR